MDQVYPARSIDEPLPGVFKVARVGVEADKQARRAEALGNKRGVPPSTERAVHDGVTRLRIEILERLAGKDGVMSVRWEIGYQSALQTLQTEAGMTW